MKQDDISSGDQIVSPEDGISKTTSDVNLNVLQNEDKRNRGAATKAMTVVLLLTFSVVFLSLNRPSPSTTVIEHAIPLVTSLFILIRHLTIARSIFAYCRDASPWLHRQHMSIQLML